jgi:type I restriction enzyme S subunit
MKSNYKPLGKYIRLVDERNTELLDLPLMGLSVSKVFFPTIANLVGTDMSTYKIVYKNQFTYIADTSRRGDKIAIALNEKFEKMLVSQAYTPFEVSNTSELDPEYLMMWFRRPEFDRYARFKSHGSAREIFDWEEMCNTLLPVPSITKQREIVKEYNVVQNRITLNQQLIQKLEETAQAVYKRWFVEFEFPNEEGIPYKSNGGEMVSCKELEKEVPKGWGMDKLKNICTKIGSGSTPTGGKESYSSSGIALIRSTNVFDFNFSFEDLAFIYDKQADKLINVEVRENDILLNITGVSVARCCMVPKNVLPARVNQHVMIIRPFNDLNISFFLLLNLCSTDSKNALLGISQSGSTREAITKAEIENFEILVPKEAVLIKFESLMKRNFLIKDLKSKENQKLAEMKGLLLSKLATIEN